MARITVEDSSVVVPNCFELVLVAAQRVRQILAGAEVLVPKDGDKNTVIALREIAENKLDIPEIYEQIVKGKQLYAQADDLDEDIIDMMESETNGAWIGLDSSDGPSFADALENELLGGDSEDEGEADAEVALSAEADDLLALVEEDAEA
jgi:DNA-directed RNA polymerase subunit omega